MRFPGFHSVDDLSANAELLRRARFGVIEIAAGRLARVHLRPWPHVVTCADLVGRDRWRQWQQSGDFCRLYYNQPRRLSNFLALRYVESRPGTTYRTIRRATEVLDEIARIKRTDAIVCDVLNARVSPRLLARHGWAPHAPSRWHRNYIKRFYGQYPATIPPTKPGGFLATGLESPDATPQFEVASFTACAPPLNLEIHASFASDGDLLLA